MIYNGDCLEFMKSESFKKIANENKICIVTDPPFNIGYHYSTYKDRMEEEQYFNMLKNVFSMYDFPFVIIHYPESIYKLSIRLGEAPVKVVSWVYNSNTAKQHRDIAFFRIKPDFRKVTQPYKNPNDKRIKKRIEAGKRGGRLYDWWNINQVKNVSKKGIDHPCVMPVEVMKNIIGIIGEGYTIFDPFMGSGTTGVACEMMGRKFIGSEINTDYCKIAKNRIYEVGNKYEQTYNL